MYCRAPNAIEAVKMFWDKIVGAHLDLGQNLVKELEKIKVDKFFKNVGDAVGGIGKDIGKTWEGLSKSVSRIGNQLGRNINSLTRNIGKNIDQITRRVGRQLDRFTRRFNRQLQRLVRVKVELPKFRTPTLPRIQLPRINLPRINLPRYRLPRIRLPRFSFRFKKRRSSCDRCDKLVKMQDLDINITPESKFCVRFQC